jgi:hypothetical protein
MKQLRNLVHARVRRKIPLFPPRRLQQRLSTRSTRWMIANMDWARTRAFCIPNANEGYSRINLHGREPCGVVELGAPYRQMCEEMIRQMQTLLNPQTDCRFGTNASRPLQCCSTGLYGW